MGDGNLQVFGGPVVLPEDGHERTPLEVSEHQSGALWSLVALQFTLLLFLPFASYRQTNSGWVRGVNVCGDC